MSVCVCARARVTDRPVEFHSVLFLVPTWEEYANEDSFWGAVISWLTSCSLPVWLSGQGVGVANRT